MSLKFGVRGLLLDEICLAMDHRHTLECFLTKGNLAFESQNNDSFQGMILTWIS